jgi:flagellin
VSLRINTNIPAMSALRNLANTDLDMAGSITRLSTGLRINTAADDPAGLIISEGMRAQIRGIHQAIANSQDAINMSKTAEAALDEVQKLLRDTRSLTVQSANTAVVDQATAQANQTQIRSVIQSINRIAEQTMFGKKKLLDGSAGLAANVTSTADVSSIYVGGTFGGVGVVAGPVTVAKTQAAARAAVSLGQTFSSPTTVVATAGSFVINGYSFTSDGTETLQSLVAKINGMSATTGVSAAVVGPVGGNYTVDLTANEYGSSSNFSFYDPLNILHNSGSASANNGANALFDVAMTTQSGVITVPFTGGRGSKESGLKLTDTDGNLLLLTEGGNTGLTGTATAVGVLDGSSVRFQIGANANQSAQFSLPKIFANCLGTTAIPGMSLADLDVTTSTGAQNAMRIIDDAVTQIAQMRGELGSFQKNFLESTVRSLNVAEENLTSSESQIRDTDVAQEMTEFTRVQILKQSGMAVLAQANKDPESVLTLLRG